MKTKRLIIEYEGDDLLFPHDHLKLKVPSESFKYLKDILKLAYRVAQIEAITEDGALIPITFPKRQQTSKAL
ncbi:MAG: hypothetical protein HYX82_03120 [Chloroflexi bacterium]|nr:hypothetical protein [Chloroflexota bacterium]